MSLQALDVAVALTAAHQQHVRGTWRPADVHRELDVPWSSLDRSLRRLEVADIVRDGWINRIALSELLPVLRYLFPLVVDREQVVRGLPTSFAARLRGPRPVHGAARVGGGGRDDRRTPGRAPAPVGRCRLATQPGTGRRVHVGRRAARRTREGDRDRDRTTDGAGGPARAVREGVTAQVGPVRLPKRVADDDRRVDARVPP